MTVRSVVGPPGRITDYSSSPVESQTIRRSRSNALLVNGVSREHPLPSRIIDDRGVREFGGPDRLRGRT
ncbi:hypothetical protein AArcCO_1449 [Halalkaliarchaeum sp. AArc-CO]|nr:hypothetical protein AArcCO_1449 [Halalkaliarchaeum sp. AArc-CO]